MSSHQVNRHVPSRNYRPTLPVCHSLSLPFCIRLPHPRQPPTVACMGPVSGPRPTGVTGHADCLPEISPQAYPVEDGYQVTESALEPGGVQRDDYTVVGVENRRLVSSLPSRFSLFHSLIDYPFYLIRSPPGNVLHTLPTVPSFSVPPLAPASPVCRSLALAVPAGPPSRLSSPFPFLFPPY